MADFAGLTPVRLRHAVEALPRKVLQRLAKENNLKVSPSSPTAVCEPHPDGRLLFRLAKASQLLTPHLLLARRRT
jgi:hypothetical protein